MGGAGAQQEGVERAGAVPQGGTEEDLARGVRHGVLCWGGGVGGERVAVVESSLLQSVTFLGSMFRAYSFRHCGSRDYSFRIHLDPPINLTACLELIHDTRFLYIRAMLISRPLD